MSGNYDILYWLLIILVPLASQINVWLTFSKYKEAMSRSGLTGERAARMILDGEGLTHVRLDTVKGSLTDHFDPRGDVIRLSDSVNGSASVAAIGVAAHECGHAIQYAQDYSPLLVRSKMLPITNFCSRSWYYIVLLGARFGNGGVGHYIMLVGVMVFAMIVIFQVATLPIELDASRRALRVIEERGILDPDERKAAKKVLTAAALTYVAALLTSLLQLMRLIMMSKRRRR